MSISDHKQALVLMPTSPYWGSMHPVICEVKISGQRVDVTSGPCGDMKKRGSVNL